MLAAAGDLGLPKPYFLIAHSMGGQIGLRAVLEGLPVNACVFSAPMWGILLSPALRPAVWAMTRAGRALGAGDKLAPGGRADAYVLGEPFADNTLTTDPAMYQMMVDHLNAHPELSLAGPSLTWLHVALRDCVELAGRPAPDVPCLTYLGSNERIVDPKRIHDRMAGWPAGELVMVNGAEHEILMEAPDTRDRVMAQILALFDANRDRPAQGQPVAC
jgi:lysophospholipase